MGRSLIRDLDYIKETADGWIQDNADEFSPFNLKNVQERELRFKAFSEYCLYLYMSHGLNSGDAPRSSYELADSIINDNDYHRYIRREPHKLLLYSFPLAYGSARGVIGDDVIDTVSSLVEKQAVWGVERPPYRMMDLWHFCNVVGVDCRWDEDVVTKLSVLRNPIDVMNSSTPDAYALTHNVLYYHNFGIDHPSFPGGAAPGKGHRSIPGLIFRYVAEENADLVLELVMAGVLQRELPVGIIEPTVSWIRELTEERGFVPGPDDNKHAETVPKDQEHRQWAEHYHTNLVAAACVRLIEDTVDSVPARRGQERSVTKRDLIDFGSVIRNLSNYQLLSGATKLRSLADDSAVLLDVYPDLAKTVKAYIEDQRIDGQYGVWTHEKIVYTEMGGAEEDFLEKTESVTDACEKAVHAVDEYFESR